jgi:hypothetical protein
MSCTLLHYVNAHIITLRICITYTCMSLQYTIEFCTPARHCVTHLHYVHAHIIALRICITYTCNGSCVEGLWRESILSYMHTCTVAPVCITYMCTSSCYAFALRTRALHTCACCITQTHTTLPVVAHNTHNINVARH